MGLGPGKSRWLLFRPSPKAFNYNGIGARCFDMRSLPLLARGCWGTHSRESVVHIPLTICRQLESRLEFWDYGYGG